MDIVKPVAINIYPALIICVQRAIECAKILIPQHFDQYKYPPFLFHLIRHSVVISPNEEERVITCMKPICNLLNNLIQQLIDMGEYLEVIDEMILRTITIYQYGHNKVSEYLNLDNICRPTNQFSEDLKSLECRFWQLNKFFDWSSFSSSIPYLQPNTAEIDSILDEIRSSVGIL